MCIRDRNPSRPLKRIGYLSFPIYSAHARMFGSECFNCGAMAGWCEGFRHSEMQQSVTVATAGSRPLMPGRAVRLCGQCVRSQTGDGDSVSGYMPRRAAKRNRLVDEVNDNDAN